MRTLLAGFATPGNVFPVAIPSDHSWDAIVAGVGAVGSATLDQLARRGARVLGLDRFHPPHDRGSSHGDTRITRLALGEGAEYAQFARRAHEIWRELEASTGRTLLRQVGGLVFGGPSGGTLAHGTSDFLETTIAIARAQGLPHEVLDAAALRERFPQFHWRGDERGCLEHTAGLVHPEACIAAQIEAAQRNGAQLHTGEQVRRWEASGSGVTVVTDRATYSAARLILGAGAWMPQLVAPLAAAKVYRQVQYWFEPDGPAEQFAPERMPVFIRLPEPGVDMFYGFPAMAGPGGGMKIAGEQFDHAVEPDAMSSEVTVNEVRAMHAAAAPHVRITGRCLRAVACKYTVLPSFSFVIDQHPASDRVWLASACSGHGFKHSAAVGEALAELALEGKSSFDLSRFRLPTSGTPVLG